MEFILSYGLFLAKMITIIVMLIICLSLFLNFTIKKQNKKGDLKIINLSKIYFERQRAIKQANMNDIEYKFWLKKYKKEQKNIEKQQKYELKHNNPKKPTLFIINFKGSMNANEVYALREEITAILSIANYNDKVLLKLESYGGVVHGYGLAASQLTRLKDNGLKLIISVDKVAASGGYMMAAVADQIIAAPFAIIGSIGVVAQIPNINRLLKKNNIDIELHTAGEYKRTLTLLGENTEHGREKFLQELHNTHQLFKDFVHHNRPNLDINSIATGEYWYGIQAKEKGLIDEIGISDNIIYNEINNMKIIEISFTPNKNIIEKLLGNITNYINNILLMLCQKK